MDFSSGEILSLNETNSTNLGVTVPLSADLAGRLRQHPAPDQNQQEQPKLTFLSSKKQDDDEEEEEDEGLNSAPLSLPGVDGTDPLDNWNEVLPGEIEETATDAKEDNENEEEENNTNKEKEDDDDDGDNNDPPPHMPVVVVNLQRLVGYVPTSDMEVQQLEHQIHAALWYGSSDAAASKTGGNPQADNACDMEQVLDAAQHFEERVTELLQSGVARHSTTQEEEETTATEDADEAIPHQVVVSYPEFLCSPKQNHTDDDSCNFAPRTVLSTAQIWKRLLKPHHIPVVESLLRHLQQCHRSLVWKHLMHQELWDLAKAEEQARTRRHQSHALIEWKTTKREHQLEQLYQVRETLEHRLDMAVAKVQELKSVRDKAVLLEIRRRRMETIDNNYVGGLEALDLNSTILAFPENKTWLGLEDDEDDANGFEDQVGPSFISDDEDEDYKGESDGSGYDAERDVEEDDDAISHGVDQPEPETAIATEDSVTNDTDNAAIPTFPSRAGRDNKARRAKVAKKRRRRLEEAAKEAEHQSKLDQARAEEAKVRELCTTTDLKMAQAILAALEKKMESVDELLESLQEETWADEEAKESGQALVPGGEEALANNGEPELSLLDQVLAMILGSFPPPMAAEDEDSSEVLAKHTQKLEAEHAKIVKEWKEYFGRLPPSLLKPEPTELEKQPVQPEGDRQSELRTTYGIEENEIDDWDDDADSDDGQSAEAEAPSPAPALRPQQVGLRPGGKVRR